MVDSCDQAKNQAVESAIKKELAERASEAWAVMNDPKFIFRVLRDKPQMFWPPLGSRLESLTPSFQKRIIFIADPIEITRFNQPTQEVVYLEVPDLGDGSGYCIKGYLAAQHLLGKPVADRRKEVLAMYKKNEDLSKWAWRVTPNNDRYFQITGERELTQEMFVSSYANLAQLPNITRQLIKLGAKL